MGLRVLLSLTPRQLKMHLHIHKIIRIVRRVGAKIFGFTSILQICAVLVAKLQLKLLRREMRFWFFPIAYLKAG